VSVQLAITQAEYIATTNAATQALWLSRLLGELLGKEVEAVELRVDSKSALALAKNLASMRGASTSESSTISSEAAWKIG